jgi:malonyl-CoA O-methyltransferase
MLNAGLRDPVLDVFRYTLTYSEPRKLLEELQGLGATNADRARARGLTGKGRYQRMLAAYEAMRVNGRIPASWEVVSAHAWGPPVGQPRRVPGGEVATFSIDSLRGSRRR